MECISNDSKHLKKIAKKRKYKRITEKYNVSGSSDLTMKIKREREY